MLTIMGVEVVSDEYFTKEKERIAQHSNIEGFVAPSESSALVALLEFATINFLGDIEDLLPQDKKSVAAQVKDTHAYVAFNTWVKEYFGNSLYPGATKIDIDFIVDGDDVVIKIRDNGLKAETKSNTVPNEKSQYSWMKAFFGCSEKRKINTGGVGGANTGLMVPAWYLETQAAGSLSWYCNSDGDGVTIELRSKAEKTTNMNMADVETRFEDDDSFDEIIFRYIRDLFKTMTPDEKDQNPFYKLFLKFCEDIISGNRITRHIRPKVLDDEVSPDQQESHIADDDVVITFDPNAGLSNMEDDSSTLSCDGRQPESPDQQESHIDDAVAFNQNTGVGNNQTDRSTSDCDGRQLESRQTDSPALLPSPGNSFAQRNHNESLPADTGEPRPEVADSSGHWPNTAAHNSAFFSPVRGEATTQPESASKIVGDLPKAVGYNR